LKVHVYHHEKTWVDIWLSFVTISYQFYPLINIYHNVNDLHSRPVRKPACPSSTWPTNCVNALVIISRHDSQTVLG
jgi:hypothetical protein